jgi:hypothetical protein
MKSRYVALAVALLAVATSAWAPTHAAAQADGFFVPDHIAPLVAPAPTATPVLTLGVLTAAPYSYLYRYPAPYPYVYARNGCLVNSAVFDAWGVFHGYQRLRVAC